MTTTKVLISAGDVGELHWRVFLDGEVKAMCWDVFERGSNPLAAGSTPAHLDQTSTSMEIRAEFELARRCAIAVARVLEVRAAEAAR